MLFWDFDVHPTIHPLKVNAHFKCVCVGLALSLKITVAMKLFATTNAGRSIIYFLSKILKYKKTVIYITMWQHIA